MLCARNQHSRRRRPSFLPRPEILIVGLVDALQDGWMDHGWQRYRPADSANMTHRSLQHEVCPAKVVGSRPALVFLLHLPGKSKPNLQAAGGARKLQGLSKFQFQVAKSYEFELAPKEQY